MFKNTNIASFKFSLYRPSLQKKLRGGLQDSSIEAIQRRHPQSKQLNKAQKHLPRPTPTLRSKETVCTKSGKSFPHGGFHCPASEAKCHKCGKRGHFQRMCRDVVNTIESRYISKDDAFLGSVGETQPWTTQLHLNGHPMTFKIDTGADVTVVSERENQRSRDG